MLFEFGAARMASVRLPSRNAKVFGSSTKCSIASFSSTVVRIRDGCEVIAVEKDQDSKSMMDECMI